MIPLRRTDWAVAAGLAAVVLALTQARPDVPRLTGQFHDDGLYVITAQALAEGRGYGLTHLPTEPPQTKFPPLYPAALAILWCADPHFPGNVPLLEWVGVLGAAAAAAGGYLFAVRFGYAGRFVAGSAAAAVATSPIVLWLATLLLAEMPFAALLLFALWRLEAALADPDRRPGFVLGAVLALPTLCRMPGVVLPVVGLLLLIRAGRRPWRPALGAAVVLAPWAVWSAAAIGQYRTDPVTGYYSDYVGWWAESGPGALARVVALNLVWVFQATADQPAAGLAALAGEGAAAKLVTAALGLAVWVLVARDARAGRPAAWVLLAYLALILVWPWPPARFVVPLQPLLAVYLFRLLGRLPAARWVVPAVAAVLVATNLTAVAGRWEKVRQRGYEPPVIQSGDPDWAAYERLFGWVRANVPADAVTASHADPVVYLFTGRKAFNPFVAPPTRVFYGQPGEALPPPAELADRLRAGGATFVVTVPGGWGGPVFVRYEQLVAGGVLARVYADPADPRLAVFRVLPPPHHD
ncbi:MAG TPA: hypothetical protein VFG68_06010 [Fimbriiglobus sp.]|nr:hypothetical protein [Fimbriiglobus sp.]